MNRACISTVTATLVLALTSVPFSLIKADSASAQPVAPAKNESEPEAAFRLFEGKCTEEQFATEFSALNELAKSKLQEVKSLNELASRTRSTIMSCLALPSKQIASPSGFNALLGHFLELASSMDARNDRRGCALLLRGLGPAYSATHKVAEYSERWKQLAQLNKKCGCMDYTEPFCYDFAFMRQNGDVWTSERVIDPEAEPFRLSLHYSSSVTRAPIPGNPVSRELTSDIEGSFRYRLVPVRLEMARDRTQNEPNQMIDLSRFGAGFEGYVGSGGDPIVIEDLNFDGYFDVRLPWYKGKILSMSGGVGRCNRALTFLYNPKSRQLELNEVLTALCHINADDHAELIHSTEWTTNCIGTSATYRWVDDELVKQSDQGATRCNPSQYPEEDVDRSS